MPAQEGNHEGSPYMRRNEMLIKKDMPPEEIAVHIRELEKQIADIEARLPAHSTPPSMIQELEELEEELERLKGQKVSI